MKEGQGRQGGQIANDSFKLEDSIPSASSIAAFLDKNMKTNDFQAYCLPYSTSGGYEVHPQS